MCWMRRKETIYVIKGYVEVNNYVEKRDNDISGRRMDRKAKE